MHIAEPWLPVDTGLCALALSNVKHKPLTALERRRTLIHTTGVPGSPACHPPPDSRRGARVFGLGRSALVRFSERFAKSLFQSQDPTHPASKGANLGRSGRGQLAAGGNGRER